MVVGEIYLSGLLERFLAHSGGGGGVSVGTQAPGYGLGLCHNTTFRGVQEFLNTEGVEKHFRLLPIRG